MKTKIILILNTIFSILVLLTEFNILSLVDSDNIKGVIALIIGFLNGKYVELKSLIGGGGIQNPPNKIGGGGIQNPPKNG